MTNLLALTDAQYEAILSEVSEIQFLIIKAGGMATKTKVENVLMTRYGFDRCDARTFTNSAESRNVRAWEMLARGLAWRGVGPEPTIEKYPELI